MAATLMSAPAHRPSMDRAVSFDHARSSSAPFAGANFDRSPSPSVSVSASAGPRSHSRNNSGASVANPANVNHASTSFPYNQPFTNNYFPADNSLHSIHPHHAWSTTALPASAFYSAPFPVFTNGPNGGTPIFQQGFQQSHADFSAWAHVYQHMVASGRMQPQQGSPLAPPQPTQQLDTDKYVSEQQQTRRRPTSGDHVQTPTAYHQMQPQHNSKNASGSGAQPPFHPYKRGPQERQRPTNEGMSRSVSQPILSSEASASTRSVVRNPSPAVEGHGKSSSIDTAPRPVLTSLQPSSAELPPPPKLGETRRDSVSSQRSGSGTTREGARSSIVSASSVPQSRTASPSAPRTVTPASSTKVSPSLSMVSAKSTPLTAGTIAANATNAAQQPRPSPLSRATMASSPEPTDKMMKSGGLKGRLRRALDKDAKKEQKTTAQSPSTPTRSVPSPSRGIASADAPVPSRAVTMSPLNVKMASDLVAPSAPFANMQAMASDVSLAETERTEAVAPSEAGGKSKRSLFRMKNMSTDNISLSSTVSSASMMIRKMGSIGKLARRNSLMGISRIFKDKPKDEDAALPEKEAKITKKEKKGSKKGSAAPASLSHAFAEPTRPSEDNDRALAGLSPAAKLARQHTARSRAEAEKKARETRAAAAAIAAAAKGTGEPTWDNNTATRQGQSLPTLDSTSSTSNVTEVVHVTAHTPTVLHAVAVTEHEYDSEDSSDGETVDNSFNMGRHSLGDDAEFQATWGNAYIDRNAVPKKGILKNAVSAEDLVGKVNRLRSNSANEYSLQVPGPLTQIPAPSPERIDGLAHGSQRPEATYDPLSPDFSPFDSAPIELERRSSFYRNAVHNTSEPSLSIIGQPTLRPPHTPRSVTAPIRKQLIWASECAVYSTFDAGTYDRRSEPATCNRLTPELAMAIKHELNTFKLEMPVHPDSRAYTHYFA